jgi:hypothetical protein
MKSEAELKTWVRTHAIWGYTVVSTSLVVQSSKLEQLFAGKKLVDAGAVVLSVEDAEALDLLLTTFRVGVRLEQGFDEHNKLRIAIEQARGKNGHDIA